jgi:hypothetical protein
VLREAFKDYFSRRRIDVPGCVREQRHKKVSTAGPASHGAKHPAEGGKPCFFVGGEGANAGAHTDTAAGEG